MLFAFSIIQFATCYDKINENVNPFCWEISMTYYCKTIAILLHNSAILLTYCTIEYCNTAIPQHYCYCFLQYMYLEKLLTVSLAHAKYIASSLKNVQLNHSIGRPSSIQQLVCLFFLPILIEKKKKKWLNHENVFSLPMSTDSGF